MSLHISLPIVFIVFCLWCWSLFHQDERVKPKDIIKRQARDMRVLQKKLAKKNLAIVTISLMVLLFVPAISSDSDILSINSGAPSIVDEQQVIEDFSIPSADGDISTDSITSFSETLADDVLFYPDTFNWTEYADSGISSP
ncbi:MAG: hypothetical protein ACTSSE_18235, partial [Candidatus Thorarchaeota archaeon]